MALSRRRNHNVVDTKITVETLVLTRSLLFCPTVALCEVGFEAELILAKWARCLTSSKRRTSSAKARWK